MAKKKKKGDEKPPKKKARPRDEDEDDVEEEEEYSPEAAAKPKLDIYVGLSAITTLVLIAAAVFFYLDHDAGKSKSLPQVSLSIGGLQGGGGNPANPDGGQIHMGPVLPRHLREEATCDALRRLWLQDDNGNVNLGDFNRLAANFGQSPRRWSQGDFTFDQLVNLADFNRLATNFGMTVAPGVGVSGPSGDEKLPSLEELAKPAAAIKQGASSASEQRRKAGARVG